MGKPQILAPLANINASLQTDGSGNFSEAAAFFAGSSLAQGFSIEGTVTLSFTGSYPPQGSRLNFMVTAGNVECNAQAGAPTTEIAYIQSDHLNSPRTVTDGQQRVIWKWDNQDPFGANMPSQDPDGDGKPYTLNLRLPGQYFDVETGLHYNYFRDYDPQTGRYIQSDPIGVSGLLAKQDFPGAGGPLRPAAHLLTRSTQTAGVGALASIPASEQLETSRIGINLYAYVDGNPVTLYDSTGEQAQFSVWRTPTYRWPPAETDVCVSKKKEAECLRKCLHLLPSPSGDLQNSEFRKCYRQCIGSLPSD